MTNEELIKKLRDLHRDPRPASAEWLFENQVALYDAAAAIEELQAEVDKYKTAWAVERENRLGVEEPKRGEWIHVQEVDIPGEIHPVAFKCMCSMCRNEYLFPKIPRYCPDCGSMNTAKMEVQDGQ